MNYEQKYKEALERARKLATDLPNGRNDRLYHVWDLENIFPELRESEDERIKRCIQVVLTDIDEKRFNDYDTTLKDCLFWLEKQGEQKPTWSEEDEKMISLLIKIFEVNHPNEHFKVNHIYTTNMEAISTKEIVDWLKSLKPNHWKPSEEQMEALKDIIIGKRAPLYDLYFDLEKL